MALKKEVAKRIRQLRVALNLSQMELAEKVGVSFQQIQKYESGKSEITLSRLTSIAHALNVSPHELLIPTELESPKENTSHLKVAEKCETAFKQDKYSITVNSTEMELISLLRMAGDNSFTGHLVSLIKGLLMSSKIRN